LKSRDRVLGSVERGSFDRLPIKHLAVFEVDELLSQRLQTETYDELLDAVGHDFREVGPAYRGPPMEGLRGGGEHGIISGVVWARAVQEQAPGAGLPLSTASSVSDLDRFTFPSTDWFDYSRIREQCLTYDAHARILGYCEMDFVNGLSGQLGFERVFLGIGARDPMFLELVARRFQFVHEHLRKGLEAGDGLIDFVHLGEDLGSQQELLFSPTTFLSLFGQQYRALMDLAHQHGARVMMHVCGSVAKMIPTLIDLGLDVLDVVQTNAVGMDLVRLREEFGRDLCFAGTVCVQKTIPFGTPAQVRAAVQQRLDLFKDGGLIIGPSHQLQVDSPIKNVLEMYRAAGGLADGGLR
jgi:uroporphyrinogen decarboxylase